MYSYVIKAHPKPEPESTAFFSGKSTPNFIKSPGQVPTATSSLKHHRMRRMQTTLPSKFSRTHCREILPVSQLCIYEIRSQSKPHLLIYLTSSLTLLKQGLASSPAQAPAAPAAIAATSVPAAPPAHIAQLQKNTQRVRFFLPKAAPPREGVG